MTAFDRAWAFLQRPDIEGGERVSDDPHDPGGLTKWGISQRAYPTVDIRNLTEAGAQALFRSDYWDRCQCDQLPDAIAIALADAAFNQGPVTAIRLLQRGLGVPIDGVMGRVTLSAACRSSVEDVNQFLGWRLIRYADGRSAYRRGWFLRVLKLKDAIQFTV